MRNVSKNLSSGNKNIPMVDETGGVILISSKAKTLYECEDPNNIPDGVSIVIPDGRVKTKENWVPEDGYMALAVSDGTHKFLMGLPEQDGYDHKQQENDDITTAKKWLYGRYDIIGLPYYTQLSEAIKDFDSKGNTDIVLDEIKPVDGLTNTEGAYSAFRIVRRFEQGVYGAGKWDLPAMGVLYIISQHVNEVVAWLDKIGLVQYKKLFTDGTITMAWSSNEYSYDRALFAEFEGNKFGASDKYTGQGFVIPVHGII